MRQIIYLVVIVFMAGSVEAGHMIKSNRDEAGHDYPDNRMEVYTYFRWGILLPGIPGFGCWNGSYSKMEHGMMPGMMGYGMGPGMWGYDANRNETFLKDTVDVRRELHIRQFDYNEALRNRGVTDDDMMKMDKEIRELQMKIKEIWWNRAD